MIKVLEVLSDTNIGGAGKVLLSYMGVYDKSEFDISVVLPKGSLLAPEMKKIGANVHEVYGLSDRSFSVKDIKELLKLFKRERPDIVHTHAALSGRIAARIYGKCKIISTRHSVFDVARSQKAFPRRQINGFINNRLSDKIIAVSPAAKDNLLELLVKEDKITVVFNGASPIRKMSNVETAEAKDRLGLRKNDFVLAIIARLEEVKGHHYILDAMEELQKAEPEIKLLIAGNGSLEKEIEGRCRGLSNVKFLGFLKDVGEVLNASDVQLNASYGTEATSIALLEGLSIGKPAIVSDFGGNPYVIADGVNGLVVKKKDSAAIKEAVLKIKNDTALYESLKLGAQKIFEEKFTLSAMAKGTEDVYRSVLKREAGK